jgi:hypothetical protein
VRGGIVEHGAGIVGQLRALPPRVAGVVEPIWVGLDVDGWGLDHGTWFVLAHLFPGADVPGVQPSSVPTRRRLPRSRQRPPVAGPPRRAAGGEEP